MSTKRDASNSRFGVLVSAVHPFWRCTKDLFQKPMTPTGLWRLKLWHVSGSNQGTTGAHDLLPTRRCCGNRGTAIFYALLRGSLFSVVQLFVAHCECAFQFVGKDCELFGIGFVRRFLGNLLPLAW